MSTVAQQNASRQNGALSAGPVTPEGKARAARNSTKHGLTGGPVVLPNESQKDYDALHKSYIETWQPATPAERDIVEQMVSARWRLARIEHMEAAILTAAFERQIEALGDNADHDQSLKDLAMSRAYAEVTENSKGWRSLDRHQRTLQRSYDQASRALMVLQEQTQKQLFEKVQADIEGINAHPVQNEPGALFPEQTEPTAFVSRTRVPLEHRSEIPDWAAA